MDGAAIRLVSASPIAARNVTSVIEPISERVWRSSDDGGSSLANNITVKYVAGDAAVSKLANCLIVVIYGLGAASNCNSRLN